MYSFLFSNSSYYYNFANFDSQGLAKTEHGTYVYSPIPKEMERQFKQKSF